MSRYGLIAAAFFVVVLPACGEGDCAGVFCGPCEAPLVVRVTDATTGSPVPDASLEGGSCDDEGVCAVGSGSGAGLYEVVLSAPGYLARTVREVVPADAEGGCCSCGYTPVRVDVVLSPV